MFDRMAKRHHERIRLQFAPVAQLCALYCNAHLKDGHQPLTAEDFMPQIRKKETRKPEPENGLDLFEKFLKVAK